MWYSVLTDNILVHKLLALSKRDGSECFSFNSFGEVVDSHYSILNATFAFGKVVDQVNLPYCKWPRTNHGSKFFWMGFRHK